MSLPCFITFLSIFCKFNGMVATPITPFSLDLPMPCMSKLSLGNSIQWHVYTVTGILRGTSHVGGLRQQNASSCSQHLGENILAPRSCNCLRLKVLVCHSSAFQTISRISFYIKSINYSGSILANLKNIMQTNQHATKKQTHIQRETRFNRNYFLWRKDLQQKMFKIFSFY